MWHKEIIPSLVSPISIVAKLLSFSLLIFVGPLAPILPIGVGFCLIGAAVATVIFAWRSEIPFAIAVPESKSVAVLASLSALVVARVTSTGEPEQVAATVLAALIASTVVVGVVSYLVGLLKLGRIIRFTPYPIIGGFMAASGWILASGSIRVILHEPLSLALLRHPPSTERLIELAVAIVFAIAVGAIRKVKHPLAFPALLLLGSVLVHIGLWLAGVSASDAHRHGWLLAFPASAEFPLPWLIASFSKVDVHAVLQASPEFSAVAMVVLATLLLTLMAIEVGTGIDVDLDKELKVNGLANALAGLCGGMVGTISANRTLFHYKMGARTRASAALAGLLCLAPMFVDPASLGLIPIPLLSALLLQLGAELLTEWLLLNSRKMQRLEFAQLILIFLAILFFDFVAGVALGIVAACITFAINTSRVQLVRAAISRENFASRVDRPLGQAEALSRHGKDIQVLRLQGFIFFGSAYGLLADARHALSRSGGACRSLVLDLRQVLGIDSSAVMNLTKLRSLAKREQVTLVFCGLSPKVAFSLRAGGVIMGDDDPLCRVFANLEEAMEWCEERLLSCIVSPHGSFGDAEAWLEAEFGKAWFFETLNSYFRRLELQPGDLVFDQGDAGDSLYLLVSGRVAVVLQKPDGGEVRLRTMLGQTLLGEMGLYRRLPRGAKVRVDERAVVYELSRKAMELMEQENPALAVAFHKYVVRVLSSRLEFANREVTALDAL
jgi:sulfate permease, SulP family